MATHKIFYKFLVAILLENHVQFLEKSKEKVLCEETTKKETKTEKNSLKKQFVCLFFPLS
jgi:hypothetical protein